MDFSKLLLTGKNSPIITAEKVITKGFTSGDEHFTQIYIYEDGEIWYVSPNGSAQAYANGVWELEYKNILFDDNVSLSSEEYTALLNVYMTNNTKIGNVNIDLLKVGNENVLFATIGDTLIYSK